MTVPAHVLAHVQDGCFVTTPANAIILKDDFKAAGVDSFFNSVDGGFEINPDPCQATTFHGFLGIETTAVSKMTKRLDYFLKKKNVKNPGNTKPQALNGTFAAAMNTSVTIDLSGLASDPNGDTLIYSLPHFMSSRDGTLSINGPVVTYTPPANASNITDGFVYQVSDGKGGVTNGLVTVLVDVI